MKMERALVYALYLVPACVLTIYGRSHIYGPIMIILGAIAVTGRVRLSALEMHRNVAVLLALALAVTNGLMNPEDPRGQGAFFHYATTHGGALFCLAVQLILIVTTKGKPQAHYVLFGALVIVFSGDVNVAQHTIARAIAGGVSDMHSSSHGYQLAVAAFVSLCALYCSRAAPGARARPKRRGKSHRALSAILIALVATTGLTSGTALYANRQGLDSILRLAVAFAPVVPSVGFSRESRLTSIARIKNQDHAIALRAYSEESPGYLRAMVYDHFDGTRWTVEAQKEAAPRSDTRIDTAPYDRPGETMYAIREDENGDLQGIEIWPSAELRDTIFSPLGASHIRIAADGLFVDAHGAAKASAFAGSSHEAYSSSGFIPDAPSSELAESLIRVPDDFDPAVAALSESLLANKETVQEKAFAVVQYFQANYEYTLGITIPTGANPLEYFLLEQPDAHCEYFASGAATLLRMGGVHCRYITGFVAVEPHPFGGYYLARNKDAHAWVEAWDPEEGWFIVEATVSAGVPHEDDRAEMSYLWDYLKQRFTEIRAAIGAWNVRALLRAILNTLHVGVSALITLPALALAVLLAVAVLLWRARRRQGPRSRHGESTALTRLREAVDGRLSALGITRLASETVHQFASRLLTLSELADAPAYAAWYRKYGEARFGGEDMETMLRELRDDKDGLT
jgi:transglutaminase-like putative cysteine protease